MVCIYPRSGICLPWCLRMCRHTRYPLRRFYIQIAGSQSFSGTSSTLSLVCPGPGASLLVSRIPYPLAAVTQQHCRGNTVKSSRIVLNGAPPFLPFVNNLFNNLGSPRKISVFVGCSAAPSPTPLTVRFFHTTPTWRVCSSSELAFRSCPNMRETRRTIWSVSSDDSLYVELVVRCARAVEISSWVSGRPAAVLWRVRFGVVESLRRDSFVRIGANASGELLVFVLVFVDGIDAVSDVPADSGSWC